MAKKKLKKTSNFLGFRLSEKTLKRLDLVANQVGKTRGLIAKDAIKQWLTLENLNQTNEMITISKTLFVRLLQSVDDEISKNYAKELAELIADIMRFLVAKPMNVGTLNHYTQFSINFFGKTGLKWFNTIDIQNQENTLVFRGLHDLDENFSIFFAHFYKFLLSEHFNVDYEESVEETTPNFIHLEFNLKNII